MKYLYGAFLILGLIGCATAHQRCMDPSFASQYRDYDQCYAEESKKKNVIQSFADGYNDYQKAHPTVNCQSTTLGSYTTTSCQ